MTTNPNKPKTGSGNPKSPRAKVPSALKLDTLVTMLRKPVGATVQELAAATAWQTHSVRGALAGALKKKGHVISSEVVDGVRRYRIAEARA